MMPRPSFEPYLAPSVVGDTRRWPGVRSTHLSHARDVLIWLPPGYHDETRRRYPVLYLHDGQNKFDPATSYSGQDWNVDGVATELLQRGEIEPFIMVAIYNSPDRLREYSPLDQGDAYLRFIHSELMPALNSELRTLGGRNNAVMGSSMGGLISLAMLFQLPDHFMGAACVSPSLWVLQRVGGPSAWLKAHAPPPQPARLYLDHGTRGAEGRGAALAKEVAAFARASGFPSSAVRYTVARSGEHNEVSWRARVDRPLKFLFGRKKSAVARTAPGRARSVSPLETEREQLDSAPMTTTSEPLPVPAAEPAASAEKSTTPITSEPQAKPGTHDTPPPAALLKFMVTEWKPAPSKLPPPIKGHEVFFARRRALSKLFPAETIIVPTGHEKVRANDTYYRFRPGSDFYYLTGNTEPDCVLVMQPAEGGGHRDILFVEPNPGRSDATFFTDRLKGELWVGPRLGAPQSRHRFNVHECRGLPDLPAFIASLNDGATRPWRMLRSASEKVSAMLPEQERDKQLATALSEMRLIKDAHEIRELKSVIASTKRGFQDVIRALKGARSEREVEGVFNLRARVEGNDVGYGTIAASGHHACILHWTRNDGRLEPGSLLLLDAGVEGNSLYTADITRTLPISGKFSKEQRAIYNLVLAAQTAAFKKVRPGNDFMEPNRAAMRVLAEGLSKLGILPMSAEEALKEEHQFYRRYSLHNVSHMLGLDVHDCAQARQEAYKFGKLKPGMVLTVEPGLYFQIDDLTVPAKYRGIGVRIEDDVLVTEKGMKNLSADIPSETDEIEAWMAKLWKEKRK